MIQLCKSGDGPILLLAVTYVNVCKYENWTHFRSIIGGKITTENNDNDIVNWGIIHIS